MTTAGAPLSSMTGFARAEGVAEGRRWIWELRSVNGRSLDVRLRLPPGLDRIENPARGRITAALGRGTVQASLNIQEESASVRVRINEEVLGAMLAAIRMVRDRTGGPPPSPEGILALRGVLDAAEPVLSPEQETVLEHTLLTALDATLATLVEMRNGEGAALGRVLSARLDEIESLTRAAEAVPARAPEAIRARLADQVAALLGASPALDPHRLHQEAALLATKADIREELDRLTAHVAAARALLAAGGAVGRKLDFLCQEFMREANTLCAKSNDRALTAIGLDLKAVVDQFREQIQNLE